MDNYELFWLFYWICVIAFFVLIWAKDWTVLITIIGWVSLLKGIILIAFPQSISSFKGIYKNTRLWGIFMIAIGLLFGYFGFII